MKNYVTNFKGFINEAFGYDIEDRDVQPHGGYDKSESSNKVYVLALYVDMSGAPGAMIESIIAISSNKEALERELDSLPEIEYDEENQEYSGRSVSDKPYYHISEHRLND